MTALLVSIGYALGALVTARHLYHNAVRGGFDTSALSSRALGIGFSLLYALAWPLLLAGLGVLWFIARPTRRDAA